MQDGSSGEEINKDSTERDERRLMELGRRTLEIFVLAHIFRFYFDSTVNYLIECIHHMSIFIQLGY